MKYLYYYQRYSNGVNREKVIRETNCFYVVKYGASGEKKISKKYMRSGEGWDTVHYYEETPELIERFNQANTINKCIINIEKLSKIRDITKEFAQDVESLCKKYCTK